ncbi:upstream activation factor subunit spp27-like isoform X2 [Gigantopelta aegis]|uniref:upstream activation factor subunit spp27-like isoform X2 n=1 Tax=Gigantopelta aegis TaxID=1735272 RepID=UPI001B88C767|nr:upstream activation factor subunit spp27-like isoform X2 [Gigantopelta aegis]
MANNVKTVELRESIQQILKGADLDTLSAKKVRRKLEEEFDVDFTERKEEIDKLVMKCITESSQQEDATDTSMESSPAKRKQTSNNKTNGKKEPVRNGSRSEDSDHQSSGSDVSLSEDEKEPQRKKKKVTDSPKASKDDAELARQLQEEEDIGGGRPRRKGTKKPPPPKKKKDDNEKKKKGGSSTYSKPCRLSPELAEVLGAEQDPKNKQYMICDTQLQKIFGKKRVRTFGMMKWLNNHIIKDGELL